MAGQLDSLFKNVAKSVVAQFGDSFDHSITYTKKTSPIYNTSSQGTGSVNNVLDVYPWLQSYLGAYMLGGAGTFQLRAVRG